MKLPKFPQRKNYEVGQLIKILLDLHKDVYIDINDIEVEHYDIWNFYKVSIYRWSTCSAGCGTKEYRDELWEKHKQAFSELFDMYTEPQFSWRWKSDSCYSSMKIETEENGSIPGITFFIKTEPLEIEI